MDKERKEWDSPALPDTITCSGGDFCLWLLYRARLRKSWENPVSGKMYKQWTFAYVSLQEGLCTVLLKKKKFLVYCVQNNLPHTLFPCVTVSFIKKKYNRILFLLHPLATEGFYISFKSLSQIFTNDAETKAKCLEKVTPELVLQIFWGKMCSPYALICYTQRKKEYFFLSGNRPARGMSFSTKGCQHHRAFANFIKINIILGTWS